MRGELCWHLARVNVQIQLARLEKPPLGSVQELDANRFPILPVADHDPAIMLDGIHGRSLAEPDEQDIRGGIVAYPHLITFPVPFGLTSPVQRQNPSLFGLLHENDTQETVSSELLCHTRRSTAGSNLRWIFHQPLNLLSGDLMGARPLLKPLLRMPCPRN